MVTTAPLPVTELASQHDILARIKSLRAVPPAGFDFQSNELLMHLDLRHARPYLQPDMTEDRWHTVREVWNALGTERAPLMHMMRGYMPIAWRNVRHSRENAAQRSVQLYAAWVWLAGELDLSDELMDHYRPELMGRENLVSVCDYYGWPWHDWANGRGQIGGSYEVRV